MINISHLPSRRDFNSYQDYIDLPLEHLGTTWCEKIRLIYHFNTLELLGTTLLHWSFITVIIFIKTRLIYHLEHFGTTWYGQDYIDLPLGQCWSTSRFIDTTWLHWSFIIWLNCNCLVWQYYIDLPLDQPETTWYGMTKLIYHWTKPVRTRLHWSTTGPNLVWQDYIDLPLDQTWYDKTTLIYHWTKPGMTRLHWSTTGPNLVWQDYIDLPLDQPETTWYDKTTLINLELLDMLLSYHFPVNTTHWANVVLMLVHHLRS